MSKAFFIASILVPKVIFAALNNQRLPNKGMIHKIINEVKNPSPRRLINNKKDTAIFDSSFTNYLSWLENIAHVAERFIKTLCITIQTKTLLD